MKHDMHKPAQLNPEFAKAMPMTGFSEIDSTVLASLRSSSSAPVPRLATPKPERKACRIFTPVSATSNDKLFNGHVSRISNGSTPGGYPLAADEAKFRWPRNPDATEANAKTTLPVKHCKESDVHPRSLESRRRPMTSDIPTRTSQRYGEDVGIQTSVRSSTSNRQESSRRQKKDGMHQDNCTAAVDRMTILSATSNTKGAGTARESGRSQEAFRRDSSRRSNTGSGRRSFPDMGHKKGGGVQQPPPLNQFWPSVGGPKTFLRPFIERNRNHLWIYDPALAGMNHREAYRYFVDKGNFERMKRMLVKKEDSLIKGNGSLQMADVMNRHHGATPERHKNKEALGSLIPSASSQIMEQAGCGEFQRPRLQRLRSRVKTPKGVKNDPFQSGCTNSDMLRRETDRRRDLLIHAGKLDNTFFRRKSYQAGDFLKQRPSTVPTVGVSGGEEYRTGPRRSSLCVTAAP